MLNPSLQRLLASARTDDMRREAEAARLVAESRPPLRNRLFGLFRQRERGILLTDAPMVTIRYAFPDDRVALARLAALDSADVPRQPVLVADVEGDLWAALSLADGGVIADPFRVTAAMVELLLARAAQLRVPGASTPNRAVRGDDRREGGTQAAPAAP